MLKIFNPEQFQGPKTLQSSHGYFEGWYYKAVSSNGNAIAIIVGLALNSDKQHAFIQTINSPDGTTTYNSFDISEFSTTKKPFSVSIGKNFFSKTKIIVGDRTEISGEVRISDMLTLPVTIFRPGIMGWFSYLPKMECYHEVVSNLVGPVTGDIDRRIEESIDATISVKYYKNKQLLFDDIGTNSGLEIVGDTSIL